MKIKLTNRGPAGVLGKGDGKLTNRGPAGLTAKLPPPNGDGKGPAPGRPPKGPIDRIRFKGANVVDIALLRPDPMNARLHPERNMEAIEDSINQHGLMSPITVVAMADGGWTVYKGNGTLEALKRLGWTKVAISLVEDMDPLEALAYGVADNRTAEHARWDFEVVAKIERAVEEAGNQLAMPGWSMREIAAMRIDHSGEEIVEAPRVFDHEQIAEAVFKHFRATGFPYPKMPLHTCMQDINLLAAADAAVLAETNLGIAVADSYQPHRWHAIAEDKYSPVQTYEDDVRFMTAIRKTLEIGGKVGKHFVEGLRYSQGAQACANFRPGFALLMYRRFAPPGGVVLDTSTGYGGRMVGFFASNLGKYIGIDPNTKTYKGNLQLAADLGLADKVTLINLPAEDVKLQQVGVCDLAFTSPPYFRKEQYSEEATQSWKRYGTGEAWRKLFLVPMMRLQYGAVKQYGRAIVNIADVKLKGQTYPLVEWTLAAAKEVGFKHESTEEYPLGRVPGAKGAKTSTEPVLIFKKG